MDPSDAWLEQARERVLIVRRRQALVFACVFASLITATIYNYVVRPVYQATAQILIERDAPQSILPTNPGVQLLATDYYETQYALLRGRTLAERVVQGLQLQNSAELQTGPLLPPWGRALRTLLGRAPGRIGPLTLSSATAIFRSRVTVEPVPSSRLVNIHFAAYDPQLAMDAANMLAQSYIQHSLDYQYANSSEAAGWLTERFEQQQAKLKAAEGALQRHLEREGPAGEEQKALVERKLSVLTTALMETRSERISKEALLAELVSRAQMDTHTLVVENAAISEARSRLAELQRQEADLSDTLGWKHTEMIRLRAEIAAVERKIEFGVQQIRQSLASAVRTARRRESELQADLEATKKEVMELSRKAIEYGALKREVESHRQLLQGLASRSKEKDLEAQLRSTNIRFVERAELPRTPASPVRGRNYLLAVLFGLALGIGLAHVRERLDNTVKTPDDVKEHLRLPFLGMVPLVPVRVVSASSPMLMGDRPQAAIAESYRLIRTNLVFSSAEGSGKVLLVGSASPQEGKTTTVANVAASLAQNGARVLAVDADLRRPTLHQHFAIRKAPGLSDLIVGNCQASAAVQVTRFKGLHVLPCGYVPPNPTELLGSSAMKEVLRAFKTHYDWVLLDTAPILAMADTPVICPYTDGLVLVVGAEVTSRPSILRAIDQIRSVGGKVLGVVLNKVNLERNSYYSQYYADYYRSYYARASTRHEGAKAVRRA